MSTNSLFGTRPRPAFIYELDVNGFIQSLETALTNLTAGYSLRLHQNGSTIATVDWNWAKEPQDTSESWTPDVRMHVASLSKIVTAIAMTKLLNEKSVSYDTPIIDYLPAYWSKGPNVNKITFAELLLNPPDYGLLPSAPCRGNGSTVKCITDNQAVLLRAPEFEDGGRKCRIRKKFIHAYRNQKSSFKPVESDHFQIGPRRDSNTFRISPRFGRLGPACGCCLTTSIQCLIRARKASAAAGLSASMRLEPLIPCSLEHASVGL